MHNMVGLLQITAPLLKMAVVLKQTAKSCQKAEKLYQSAVFMMHFYINIAPDLEGIAAPVQDNLAGQMSVILV